ncbi:B-cell receptor CD22-like [Pygocentrus nattereri]|uniref:B-cell receptor CD22-like n=1 Tax=Pygocentrus nattereri TaxID=42514 RepID=UPI0018912611|nr:B-cell receptor CD22-like [Pygocentrus nattereri]
MVPVLYHHLLFLIVLTPGDSAQRMNANHAPLKQCALNESSVELLVKIPGSVVEGTTATLTCQTTCNLTDPTFIWYKNGRPLTTKTIKNNQLHLQTVSSEDAGSYSCAVGGSQHLRSTAHSLRVRYPPKRVSVSISPSGEIVEGSSATLTCSSDGNPPVECYWFIGTLLVVKEKNYTIPSASSEDSGEYKCKCRNELGEKYSEALTLDVWYPTKNISVSISPSGEIVEGSSVTLTCSSDGNPPAKNYTWFKEGGTSPVGSGQNYSIVNINADHKGWYHCEAWNKLGKQNVALSRPPDDNNKVLNTYATSEETYAGLNDTGSSFFEVYHALDNTYVVPGYTEEFVI